MNNSKGYMNIGIIALLVISILAVGGFVKKNYFSQNSANPASTSQTSNYGFRFDTRYGGQFDLNYPLTYFAGQDYFNKSIKFTLTGCQEKCETLVIATTKRDLSESKKYTIEGKEYSLSKNTNSDGSVTFLLEPKWTDKLGLIEIKSYSTKEELPSDFYKIISSLQYVKEIAVIEVSPPPSPYIAVSSKPFIQPSPSSQIKPYLTQTGITIIPAQTIPSDFFAQTTTFEHQYFKIHYPKNWDLRSSFDYPAIIENPEGAWDTHSHAGIIHKNSFLIREAGVTSLSVEDIMKDLDQKRDAIIKRDYEVWQESKAQDSRVPAYSQYYRPYTDKRKIIKGEMEYIIFNDLGEDYFIASNKKSWVRGTGSYINDKNSIERKMLESIILK